MTQQDTPEISKTQEVAERREQATVIRAVSIEVSGPVPHPELLTQYNSVIPEGANRVVELVEGQVHHRQTMEACGQIFAFVLAMLTLSGGIGLIALGAGIQGLVPLVAAVVGLVGLFVYREMQSKKDDARL